MYIGFRPERGSPSAQRREKKLIQQPPPPARFSHVQGVVLVVGGSRLKVTGKLVFVIQTALDGDGCGQVGVDGSRTMACAVGAGFEVELCRPGCVARASLCVPVALLDLQDGYVGLVSIWVSSEENNLHATYNRLCSCSSCTGKCSPRRTPVGSLCIRWPCMIRSFSRSHPAA